MPYLTRRIFVPQVALDRRSRGFMTVSLLVNGILEIEAALLVCRRALVQDPNTQLGDRLGQEASCSAGYRFDIVLPESPALRQRHEFFVAKTILAWCAR